jgi:hypothetical protein
MKKLMKMRSLRMLLFATKNHRKSCEEQMDFLRNPDERPCAKVCGKAVENWRISGGTEAEKTLTSPTMPRI